MNVARQGAPWLRSAPFDFGFIAGVFALALLTGGVALVRPSIFSYVVAADLWLLAYPHVASMYTRLAFEPERRFLLFGLPPIVLLATAGAAWLGGAIVLNTVYFVWQTWHYTRQSYGIARAYARSAGALPEPAADVVIYAFPLWGLLHRFAQRPSEFFGAPLYSPPMPSALVTLAGLVAIVSLGVWTLRRVRGGAHVGHTLFVLSHVAITSVSYIVVRDVTQGWLFINVWHNAQYLLFVWAFNARRFAGGVDPERRLLSTISQRKNVAVYALVCAGIGVGFYFVLGRAIALAPMTALPLVLVTHQAINFHHYVVDAIIWRRRAKA